MEEGNKGASMGVGGAVAEAGFEVKAIEPPLHALRLYGPLMSLWADNLTLNLSARHLNIVRGFARQEPDGRWVSEFLLATEEGSADPASLDYVALAQAPPSDKHAGPVVLDDYLITRSPGSSLILEVRASDRLGFLGSLLRALSRLSLFPREMAIGTDQGEILDRFELVAAQGEPPTEASQQALARMLDGMLRGRRSGASAFF
jgi:hypothetical protein